MEGEEAQAEGVQQPNNEVNQMGPLCQVEGCSADLLSEKKYCLKKKICSQHMQSDVVHKRGEPAQQWRFCFQCGKLEPLERFDGKQRSCRTRLELRRKPKRSNSSLDAPRQQEPASPSARKAKRSRRSNHSSSCALETEAADAGSGQWDQDQSLMQAVMWQFACGNNGGCAADAGACDLSSCGAYTADSCQGDTAAAIAAATAAAMPQQSREPVCADATAAVQAAAGIAHTSTAVSANAVAALLSEQVSALKPAPRAASAPAAAAASAGYNLEDLKSPRALRGHMASLQKQCQVLQSQLAQQRQQQQSASGCRPAASAAAGFARAAAVPAASSRGMAAVMQPPVLATRANSALQQQQQQQQQMALQRHGSRDTPSSPDESGMTAVTAVNHMDLVEMVVAQLNDSNTSAAADALEAMLEHELRAAASLPPEHAKNTWASQLNDVINDWSSVISSAAMPPYGGCFAAPAAGAACAAPFGGLLARQHGADFWGMGAGLTASQGAVPAAPVDSAGKKAFDLKLMTLQQQLSDLQGLVYNLRAQFTS